MNIWFSLKACCLSALLSLLLLSPSHAELRVMELPEDTIKYLTNSAINHSDDPFGGNNEGEPDFLVVNPFPEVFSGKVIDLKKILKTYGVPLAEEDFVYYFFDKQILVARGSQNKIDLIEALLFPLTTPGPILVHYQLTFQSIENSVRKPIASVKAILRSGSRAKVTSPQFDCDIDCILGEGNKYVDFQYAIEGKGILEKYSVNSDGTTTVGDSLVIGEWTDDEGKTIQLVFTATASDVRLVADKEKLAIYDVIEKVLKEKASKED
ncbi:MAG: hypothetical protein ACSHX0_08650 [Akkermansiaceae bacterium]